MVEIVRQAVTARWMDIAGAFSDYSVELRDFTDCEADLVVVEQAVVAQGRGSGIEARGVGATLWKVRDGKIVSGKLFQSKAEALEAAGLAE